MNKKEQELESFNKAVESTTETLIIAGLKFKEASVKSKELVYSLKELAELSKE